MKLYKTSLKVLATVCLLLLGAYEAINNPSNLDIIRGAIHGVAIYVIWSNKED